MISSTKTGHPGDDRMTRRRNRTTQNDSTEIVEKRQDAIEGPLLSRQSAQTIRDAVNEIDVEDLSEPLRTQVIDAALDAEQVLAGGEEHHG